MSVTLPATAEALIVDEIVPQLGDIAADLSAILLHEYGGADMATEAESISVGEHAVRANDLLCHLVGRIRLFVAERRVLAGLRNTSSQRPTAANDPVE
jgi:hypothetical protein